MSVLAPLRPLSLRRSRRSPGRLPLPAAPLAVPADGAALPLPGLQEVLEEVLVVPEVALDLPDVPSVVARARLAFAAARKRHAERSFAAALAHHERVESRRGAHLGPELSRVEFAGQTRVYRY